MNSSPHSAICYVLLPLLLSPEPAAAAAAPAAQELPCLVSHGGDPEKPEQQRNPRTAMAENAGLENHRIKSFKNKGRDVEVSWHFKYDFK